MTDPRWKTLVLAWRALGRHGLTVPYLCAATGVQPYALVESLYLHQVPIFRCGQVLAPVVGGGFAPYSGMSGSTVNFLRRWFNVPGNYPIGPAAEHYADLALYAHGLLAEGKVSVSYSHGDYLDTGKQELDVRRYGPFTDEERAFVYRVLGKLPPKITGVGSTGRIIYDYSR